MKFFVQRLQPGDVVDAHIVELLDHHAAIINFAGDLLRVQNETNEKLKVGDRVTLTVAAINPLRFQLQRGSAQRRVSGHLDVNI